MLYKKWAQQCIYTKIKTMSDMQYAHTFKITCTFISFSGAKFHQDLTDAEGLQSVLAGNPDNGKERTMCELKRFES